MGSLKSVFGVLGALIPVVYCGGLLYYFIHNAGSVHDAQEIGLGPTLLGLAVVGGLFSVAVLVRIAWIFARAGSSNAPTRRRPDAPTHDDDGDFDADAVIARHLARRSADVASGSLSARPTSDGGAPAKPTFGRKGT